ncbi:MAG: hypothetical protein ACRC7N_02190 [Clostridium sp.]
MEGKYNITLNTPMGVEHGILDFVINDGNVQGSITGRNHVNKITSGQVKGNTISFMGEIKIAIMKIRYDASCRIENGEIKGFARTKYGEFQVSGFKI